MQSVLTCNSVPSRRNRLNARNRPRHFTGSCNHSAGVGCIVVSGLAGIVADLFLYLADRAVMGCQETGQQDQALTVIVCPYSFRQTIYPLNP